MKRYLPLLAIGLVCAVVIALVVRQSPSESTRGRHVEEESDALGPVPTAMGPGSDGIFPGSAGTKPTFTTSTAAVPHEKLDAQTLLRVKELEKMELEKRRRDQAAAKTHEARVELAVYKSDAWKKVRLTNREKFEALRAAAALSPDKMVPCTICDGKGVLDLCVICDHTGKCPTCHGTGKVLDEICPACQGSGKCFLCFRLGENGVPILSGAAQEGSDYPRHARPTRGDPRRVTRTAKRKPPTYPMKANLILTLIALTCLRMPLVAAGADPGAKTGLPELKRAVIANYAALACAGFEDSLASAKKLQSAVGALLDKPSEETMAGARQAWLAAHQTYSLTETFRFYNGPIDQVEALVNSWPIDASYIDSVADAPDAGIVNAASNYPAISRALVISLNAKDGKQNISTGFHAIEFLLWGQPPGGRGAGNRSWHDYADGGKNVQRRREYLRLVTDLVVEHLQTVANEWTSGKTDNFRAQFLAKDPNAALADVLMGMGALSGPEMSGERLTTAYETKERAEQQDCFSNSTCDDLINNAIGIQNVFLGQYTSSSGQKIEGPGVFGLLKQVDPDFAGKLSAQVSSAVAAVHAIPAPFDQAILGTNQAPNRIAMKKAITALHTQSDMIAEAARMLSIALNFKE